MELDPAKETHGLFFHTTIGLQDSVQTDHLYEPSTEGRQRFDFCQSATMHLAAWCILEFAQTNSKKTEPSSKLLILDWKKLTPTDTEERYRSACPSQTKSTFQDPSIQRLAPFLPQLHVPGQVRKWRTASTKYSSEIGCLSLPKRLHNRKIRSPKTATARQSVWILCCFPNTTLHAQASIVARVVWTIPTTSLLSRSESPMSTTTVLL